MTRICLLLLLASPVWLAAGPARAAETVRPNILFIVSDDLAACLGCYGNTTCRTPYLDRLAREGVRFDCAYCQYPVCGPSRASFMSGLYPNRTGIRANSEQLGSYRVVNPMLADHPSIGGFLRGHGYYSVRVSKIFHMGVPGTIHEGTAGGDEPDSWTRAINIKAGSPGARENLSPKLTSAGTSFTRVIVPDASQETLADYQAVTQAIAILKERPTDRPFFWAVGLVRPHVPLAAPRRLFDLYPEADIRLPVVPDHDLDDVPGAARAMENARRYGMNERQQRLAIAGYYACVTFLDEQVGRLLAELDRLDLRKNTIIVFTSDHGYSLGEHHCWQKLSLFEEAARVPLIIAAPGLTRSAGRASKQIVELIDLYPTLADLADLGSKAPTLLQGTSLRPLLEDLARQDWPKDFAYTVTRGGESIRTPRWRYNRWASHGEELYDHHTDPHEFRNLAAHADHADVLKNLRLQLQKARTDSR